MTGVRILVAPTLETMTEIYVLPREGGPRSPRFAAYVARVEHSWGLTSYNPMAGPVAHDTVRALIEIDAERLAGEQARELAVRCDFDGDITIAVAVPSGGMWTDRLATEIQHRTIDGRRGGHGTVLLWPGDALDECQVNMECAAEVVRIMWTAHHGVPTSLSGVLAREGLCYALAPAYTTGDAVPHSSNDNAAVESALVVLGDTSMQGDIVGLLYGDAAAIEMGWTPLGLAEKAGYRWAISRARAIVERVGASAALRGNFPPTPTST
jgi:hypothetical protein